MESKLGKQPILSITTKFCLQIFSSCFYRQGWYYTLIYQQLLEGGFAPLVLSDATERILRHPIYQLPLKGGYDPLIILLLTLEPPNLPHMIIWSLTVLQLIYQLKVQRHLFKGLKIFYIPSNISLHSAVTYIHRDSSQTNKLILNYFSIRHF